jgi:L-alanine-DL-glutamate epimerase-like enolase superfamily enzyme
MPLMVGGMVESHLGMTTAAHLVAALGGVAFPDLDTAWLLAENPFQGGYVSQREGAPDQPGPLYTLPEVPGLGIERR